MSDVKNMRPTKFGESQAIPHTPRKKKAEQRNVVHSEWFTFICLVFINC